MYKKVELPENSFAKMEQKVQESWKKNNIIKKSLDIKKGKRYFGGKLLSNKSYI